MFPSRLEASASAAAPNFVEFERRDDQCGWPRIVEVGLDRNARRFVGSDYFLALRVLEFPSEADENFLGGEAVIEANANLDVAFLVDVLRIIGPKLALDPDHDAVALLALIEGFADARERGGAAEDKEEEGAQDCFHDFLERGWFGLRVRYSPSGSLRLWRLAFKEEVGH